MFDDADLVCTCCGEVQTSDNKKELCRYWGNREVHIWGDEFKDEDQDEGPQDE